MTLGAKAFTMQAERRTAALAAVSPNGETAPGGGELGGGGCPEVGAIANVASLLRQNGFAEPKRFSPVLDCTDYTAADSFHQPSFYSLFV